MSSQRIHLSAPVSRHGILGFLFPPQPLRFRLALLLTFFPCAIFYPLTYPAGEIITLCCWLWAMPSALGWLAMLLVPIIPHEVYGYYAFNLFSVVAAVAIASSAARAYQLQPAGLAGLLRFTRGCMVVELAIAALQAVSDPSLWMAIFTDMRLEPGRGAGLRLEPSQLSCLLALYLSLLLCHAEAAPPSPAHRPRQRRLRREALVFIVATILLTRSFSVLIIVLCFVPALFLRGRRVAAFLAVAAVGALAGVLALGDRIRNAAATSGGSLAELITSGVGSWRNVPDLLILANPGDFLLPGNPTEVRIKIHTLAALTSPAIAWIQNTFSIFAAASVTLGLCVVVALMLFGLRVGMRATARSRPLRATWLLTFVAAWFFVAKWDPTLWLALGLLPMACRLRQQSRQRLVTLDCKTLERKNPAASLARPLLPTEVR